MNDNEQAAAANVSNVATSGTENTTTVLSSSISSDLTQDYMSLNADIEANRRYQKAVEQMHTFIKSALDQIKDLSLELELIESLSSMDQAWIEITASYTTVDARIDAIEKRIQQEIRAFGVKWLAALKVDAVAVEEPYSASDSNDATKSTLPLSANCNNFYARTKVSSSHEDNGLLSEQHNLQ